MITLLIRAGHANGVKNPPVRERAGPESNPGWHGSGSSSEGLTPQNAAACLSRSSLRAWLGSIPPRSSRGPLPCAWPWRASWRAIAAQRQRLAAPGEAVVQSPAMRATPDELQQVEPIAIGESLARITCAHRLDGGVRGKNKVCVSSTARMDRLLSQPLVRKHLQLANHTATWRSASRPARWPVLRLPAPPVPA